MYRLNAAYPYGVVSVQYIDPYLIRQEMANLIYWIQEIAPSLHPVEYAALLHQKFVSIHPFTDGNVPSRHLLRTA